MKRQQTKLTDPPPPATPHTWTEYTGLQLYYKNNQNASRSDSTAKRYKFTHTDPFAEVILKNYRLGMMIDMAFRMQQTSCYLSHLRPFSQRKE